LREKLKQLPRGSKRWCALNRQLLHKTVKTSIIPALRGQDGTWITDRHQKANTFSASFIAKSQLPAGHSESEQDVSYEPSADVLGNFVVLRMRWARRLLKSINDSKATGPDLVPGKILKQCYRELAAPLVRLARLIVEKGKWPCLWKFHWIFPLYKKGFVSNPANYRGLHLTSVLSKLIERLIGCVLTSFLHVSNAYGSSQWAFRPEHSCRDLITLLTLKWILAFHLHFKVGLFLGDISGAFDRVFTPTLLAKCRRAGVGEAFIRLLQDFFEPRTAQVIVDGVSSDPFTIQNQVYQGTVLGPPMWNTFFADVTVPLARLGFEDFKFADFFFYNHTARKPHSHYPNNAYQGL